MDEHLAPPHKARALTVLTELSDEALRHLRDCATCRAAWYRAGAWKAGCCDPRLGAVASLTLGDTATTTERVQSHISECLACAVERRAWEAFIGAPHLEG